MPLPMKGLSVAQIQKCLEGDDVCANDLMLWQKDTRLGVQRALVRRKQRLDKHQAEQLRLKALLKYERAQIKAGAHFIVGVDEVGAGPLAGPVVAAAVMLDAQKILDTVSAWWGLDDSKRVSKRRRHSLASQIWQHAAKVSIGSCSAAEIDASNIFCAGLEAMRRAVSQLGISAAHTAVLVDARVIPGGRWRQQAVVGGDRLCASVAAASIVAKVWRDAWMQTLGSHQLQYGFEAHAGYGTPKHLDALQAHGPCAEHRYSFAPVARA